MRSKIFAASLKRTVAFRTIRSGSEEVAGYSFSSVGCELGMSREHSSLALHHCINATPK
jgi:hypothetical protein